MDMEYSAEMIQVLAPYLIPLAIALVVVSLLIGINRRVRGRIIARRPQHRREVNLVANIVQWTLLVIILMTLLEALNVPLGNVWTAISTVIALVAIGFFAVWSLLSHMTAAVVLFFQRPFREGEYLQFADENYFGRVVKTGLFYTIVEDTDGGRSQIPNNLLFQKRFRVSAKAPAPKEY